MMCIIILGFTGFLDKLYKSKEITKDLKNLGKPVFEKVEKFILQKIESHIQNEQITRSKKGTKAFFAIIL